MDFVMLKEKLTEAKEAFEREVARREKLLIKQQEMYSELQALDFDLAAAESARDEKLREFCHEEATPKDVETARNHLDNIKKKRDETSEFLRVLDGEIKAFPDLNHHDNSFKRAIRLAQSDLWLPILESERSKARRTVLTCIARIYLADIKSKRSVGGGGIFNGQLHHVFDAEFIREVQSEAPKYEEIILKEYDKNLS